MTLFQAKVLPTLTYGLDIIWDNLTVSDLNIIESLKARYLKRILGISKTAPSRLAYELAREPFLIEKLRLQMQLPSTYSETQVLQSRLEKREMIELEFY